MPREDDGSNELDPLINRSLEASNDLSERSAWASGPCDNATAGMKRAVSDAHGGKPGGGTPMEWDIIREEAPELTVVRARGSVSVSASWVKVADLVAVKDPLCPVLFDGRHMKVTHLSLSKLI